MINHTDFSLNERTYKHKTNDNVEIIHSQNTKGWRSLRLSYRGRDGEQKHIHIEQSGMLSERNAYLEDAKALNELLTAVLQDIKDAKYENT